MNNSDIFIVVTMAVVVIAALIGLSAPSDKEKRYNEVIAACEELQPRHISCDVFAAPTQRVFVQPTQTDARPQQGRPSA